MIVTLQAQTETKDAKSQTQIELIRCGVSTMEDIEMLCTMLKAQLVGLGLI